MVLVHPGDVIVMSSYLPSTEPNISIAVFETSCQVTADCGTVNYLAKLHRSAKLWKQHKGEILTILCFLPCQINFKEEINSVTPKQ